MVRLLIILSLIIHCVQPRLCDAKKPQEALEFEAKLALIYNFAKFTTWPDDTFQEDDTPFTFAVLGENPFGETWDILDGKMMHGRPIVIRHFPGLENLEDPVSVQVLYCAIDDLEFLIEENPDLLYHAHVLTVGAGKGFVAAGGILQLDFIDEHLAFEVNIGTARLTEVEISSNLLKLATDVIE